MKLMPLAAVLTVVLTGCVRVRVEHRAASESAQCYPHSAPSPADSIACVRVAVDALERRTGERFAYVAQFRESSDSVLVLLAGGPSPPWIGGGGLVAISRQSGAHVVELYQ